MKKALVLLQGIATKHYIEKALVDSAIPTDQYDLIEYIPTEKYLDKGSWFSWILLRVPFIRKHWDRFGDIFRYFYNKKTRKKVCSVVNEYISELKKKDYEVDILSHSLGSIIGLTCGKKKSPLSVGKFYAFGSPLGFAFKPFRSIVNKHVDKYSYNLSGERFHLVFNDEDIVSKKEINIKGKKKINDIFKSSFISFPDIGDGHSVKSYLQDFYLKHPNFFTR